MSIFSFININAQSFEGKIIYKNNFQSKVTNYPSENINRLMGTRQEYYIKGNNYKSIFNGLFIKLQMYRGQENKSYSLTAKSDTLYWEDYSLNKDKAISYEIKKNQDTVLGILCDVIIIKAEMSKTYFYYSRKYEINPELFKQHNYGNWYYIISKTKALPLKTIFENKQFILTSIATKIIPMKLGGDIFEIRDKNKVAKATW
jgi:hypothetical protein